MFLNGLHRVAEIRETAEESKTQTDVIVRLTAESSTGASILVSFTDRSDISLTLIRTRPNPVIQMSRPRADMAEFLGSFPLGALVTSSFHQTAGGKPGLRLALADTDQLSLRDGDLLDAPTASPQDKTSGLADELGVDSALHGLWTIGGRHYEFRSDGSYLVHDTSAFELVDGGAHLNWGNMQFDRLSGDPSGVIGHWQTAAQDEDVLLRADGTYVWHGVAVFPDAVGEWSVAGSDLTSRELRATVTASGGQISFDLVYAGTESGTYTLSAGGTVLTVDFFGRQVVYTRA